MNTLEIEDVLSSIRRLVSDEEPKPVAKNDSIERFVLTPAFRVLEDPVEDVVEQTANSVAASTDVQAVDVAESVQLFLDEADKSEADEADLASLSVSGDEAPQEMLIDEADIAEIEASQSDTESFRSKAEAEPAELFAQLETAVGQVNEEWEPDGSEPEAGEMPEQHIFASYRSQPRPVDTVSDFSESVEVIDAPVAENEAGTLEVETHEAEIENSETLDAPLEAANVEVELTDAPVEQDDPSDVEIDSSAEKLVDVEAPIADARETEVDELRAAGVAAFAACAPNSAADSEEIDLADQLLDEDSLRELVAEIVREELQGTLGERITRNVRRMVRREIQRALALKEFE